MKTRQFALIAGAFYLILGIVGFTPAFLAAPSASAPYVPFDVGYGYLFGLFPVNVILNYKHLVFGFWGIVAYNDYAAARLYARVLAVMSAFLAVFGLIPVTNTGLGMFPLFSADILLHAVTAIAAGYVGFFMPEPAPQQDTSIIAR